MPPKPVRERFHTKAIHYAEPEAAINAVVPPIYLSNSFRYTDDPWIYSRVTGNPNRSQLEARVAALEHANEGIVFSSGMAVITAVLSLAKSGEHVLFCETVYGGTFELATTKMNSHGVEISFADMRHAESIARHIRASTKMVYLESPCNPDLTCLDIQGIAKAVHGINSNIIVVVDNTFMSPYLQRPIDLGADISLHSVSKYINGHSDLLMGIALTSREDIARELRNEHTMTGAVPSPFDLYLVSRSLKTLPLRMSKHCSNALAVARYLQNSPYVARVRYPGLENDPGYDINKKQTINGGGGGMVAAWLQDPKGHQDLGRRTWIFCRSLKVISFAPSLGGVESLCLIPALASHRQLSPEELRAKGILPNLIRLSIGVEDEESLLEDLERALTTAFSPGSQAGGARL